MLVVVSVPVIADTKSFFDLGINELPEEWIDENGHTYYYLYKDEVALIKTASPKSNDTVLKIPETMIRDGKTYKVTLVGSPNSEFQATMPPIGKGYKKIIYGKNVRLISGYAHYKLRSLEEINFTGNNIDISDYAFTLCKNLKIINGFKRITSLGYGAFSGTGIESLKIGKNLEHIGGSAFSGNKKLKALTITKTRYIDSFAFANCTNLEKVNIKNGVKYIDESAFEGCERLKKVTLPRTLSIIASTAFSDCNVKMKVTISKKNNNYCIKNNNLLSKDKKKLIAMFRRPQIVEIPSYVTCVENGAIPYYVNVRKGVKIKAVVSKNPNTKFNKYAYPGKDISYYYPIGGKRIKIKNAPKEQYRYSAIKIIKGKRIKYKG